MRKTADSTEIVEVLEFYYAAAKRANRDRGPAVEPAGKTPRLRRKNPRAAKPRRVRRSSAGKRLLPRNPNRTARF